MAEIKWNNVSGSDMNTAVGHVQNADNALYSRVRDLAKEGQSLLNDMNQNDLNHLEGIKDINTQQVLNQMHNTNSMEDIENNQELADAKNLLNQFGNRIDLSKINQAKASWVADTHQRATARDNLRDTTPAAQKRKQEIYALLNAGKQREAEELIAQSSGLLSNNTINSLVSDARKWYTDDRKFLLEAKQTDAQVESQKAQAQLALANADNVRTTTNERLYKGREALNNEAEKLQQKELEITQKTEKANQATQANFNNAIAGLKNEFGNNMSGEVEAAFDDLARTTDYQERIKILKFIEAKLPEGGSINGVPTKKGALFLQDALHYNDVFVNNHIEAENARKQLRISQDNQQTNSDSYNKVVISNNSSKGNSALLDTDTSTNNGTNNSSSTRSVSSDVNLVVNGKGINSSQQTRVSTNENQSGIKTDNTNPSAQGNLNSKEKTNNVLFTGKDFNETSPYYEEALKAQQNLPSQQKSQDTNDNSDMLEFLGVTQQQFNALSIEKRLELKGDYYEAKRKQSGINKVENITESSNNIPQLTTTGEAGSIKTTAKAKINAMKNQEEKFALSGSVKTPNFNQEEISRAESEWNKIIKDEKGNSLSIIDLEKNTHALRRQIEENPNLSPSEKQKMKALIVDRISGLNNVKNSSDFMAWVAKDKELSARQDKITVDDVNRYVTEVLKQNADKVIDNQAEGALRSFFGLSAKDSVIYNKAIEYISKTNLDELGTPYTIKDPTNPTSKGIEGDPDTLLEHFGNGLLDKVEDTFESGFNTATSSLNNFTRLIDTSDLDNQTKDLLKRSALKATNNLIERLYTKSGEKVSDDLGKQYLEDYRTELAQLTSFGSSTKLAGGQIISVLKSIDENKKNAEAQLRDPNLAIQLTKNYAEQNKQKDFSKFIKEDFNKGLVQANKAYQFQMDKDNQKFFKELDANIQTGIKELTPLIKSSQKELIPINDFTDTETLINYGKQEAERYKAKNENMVFPKKALNAYRMLLELSEAGKEQGLSLLTENQKEALNTFRKQFKILAEQQNFKGLDKLSTSEEIQEFIDKNSFKG